MPVSDPLAVLCALLDRSIAQIAEASADARTFDRELVIRVSDIWDNNTSPLFHAAVGTKRRRSGKRAAEALLWMAEFRREWMVEQAAVAGFALEESLPPSPLRGPYRDYAGKVQPWPQALTAEVTEEVAADYDLAAAQVIGFRAERAGRYLNAHIAVRVPRRFPADTSAPAVVTAHLRDVARLEVAASDLHGAAAAVTSEGLTIALGGQGFVQAASGHLSIDDPAWHLSAAGGRADAAVPRDTEREERPRLEGELSKVGGIAARRLADTMRGIRSMRYLELVDLRAVSERCERYTGAGAMLLDAAHQRTARQRDVILRRLADAGQTPLDMRPKVESGHRPPAPAAELRMVKYTADHERYGQSAKEDLLRHYAVPHGSSPNGDPWQISVLRDPEPQAFRVQTEDFQTSS